MGEMIVFAGKMAIAVLAVAATAVLIGIGISLLGSFVFNSAVGELFAIVQMWLPFDLGTLWGFFTLAVTVISAWAVYTATTTMWKKSKDV